MVTECDNGTFGHNCVHNCSVNCLKHSPCNKENGHCDGGCNPGYTNDNCSKGKCRQSGIKLFDLLFKPITNPNTYIHSQIKVEPLNTCTD